MDSVAAGSDLQETPAIPLTEVLNALYRGLLGREPDQAGFEHWLRVARTAGLASAVKGFAQASEVRQHLQIDRPLGKQWSASQHGEVEVLLKLMLRRAFNSTTVVDVGAADSRISNTVDFIAGFGWRGLLIEPNPSLARNLRRQLAPWRAEVVECAISTSEGESVLHLGVNDHVSSLLPASTSAWGEITGELTVPVRRLGEVLETHGIEKDFALLSIDIEGLDIPVVNDLIENSPFRPRWIILEWGADYGRASIGDERISYALREEYRLVEAIHGNVILEHYSAGRH